MIIETPLFIRFQSMIIRERGIALATLSQAKTLGGVGSLLVLLTAAPTVGAVLGIAGFILTLVAVKYISDLVQDKSIFDNMLISIILAIAGTVVGTLVILGSVFRFMGMHNAFVPDFNPANVPTGDWIGLAGSVIIGLVAIWAIITISAVFLRRSYSSIASKLNVGMFGTAGTLYLVGAATTIIAIGFLLIFVAQILLAVAFFSIEERAPAPTQAQAMPAGQP